LAIAKRNLLKEFNAFTKLIAYDITVEEEITIIGTLFVPNFEGKAFHPRQKKSDAYNTFSIVTLKRFELYWEELHNNLVTKLTVGPTTNLSKCCYSHYKFTEI
jgi:hypothetical protein